MAALVWRYRHPLLPVPCAMTTTRSSLSAEGKSLIWSPQPWASGIKESAQGTKKTANVFMRRYFDEPWATITLSVLFSFLFQKLLLLIKWINNCCTLEVPKSFDQADFEYFLLSSQNVCLQAHFPYVLRRNNVGKYVDYLSGLISPWSFFRLVSFTTISSHHGNARYVLDGHWYPFIQEPTTTVTHGKFISFRAGRRFRQDGREPSKLAMKGGGGAPEYSWRSRRSGTKPFDSLQVHV